MLETFTSRLTLDLTQTMKQEPLVRDAEKYSTNVTCIQVTKISELISIEMNKYRLICTETSNKHYGNGSLVCPKEKHLHLHHIYKFWRINS